MTPADVLAEAAVAGFAVVLRDDGTPALKCAPGLAPNAALKAALREHRAGIIRLLGGTVEPATCPGYVFKAKRKDGTESKTPVPCGAVVFEAEDSDFFCPARAWCPFRAEARRRE